MAMNKFLLNKDNARFLRLLKGVKEVSTLAIDFQFFRSFLYSRRKRERKLVAADAAQAGWLFRNRNTVTGVEKR
jgi:hypothetical protein